MNLSTRTLSASGFNKNQSQRLEYLNDMYKSYTTSDLAAQKSISPGVGAYNIKSSFDQIAHRAPQQSLSHKTHKEHINQYVGPGAYNVGGSSLRGGSTMSKCRLQNSISSNASVGPGTYAPEDAFQKQRSQKGFSLSGRHEDLSKYQNPGVGQYNIAKNEQIHGGTMARRYDKFQNFHAIGTNNPGVGEYKIPDIKRHQISMSFSKPSLDPKDQTPGANAYDVKLQKNGALVKSFGIRHNCIK